MAFFLYARESCITGRALARALGLNLDSRGRRVPSHADTVIRWGSLAALPAPPIIEVNEASAVRRATDKLNSLMLMSEAGVPVPAFTTDAEGVEWPCLARRRHHTRGNDVIAISSAADARIVVGADYFIQQIDKVREFRIHVMCGEPFLCQRKVGGDESSVVWNHTHGFRYVNMRSTRPDTSRLEAAVMAVRTLGLDFGAVDIIIDRAGNCYVLEVNTAPGLAVVSATEYVRRFAELIGQPESRLRLDRLAVLGAEE